MNDLTQARKLIKECQDTQNPYLELGCCGITDLNDLPELFECNHLETLILSNRWTDINERVYIKSNNTGVYNLISSIPQRISSLNNLKELIIGGEIEPKLSDIFFLGKLTSLQYLDLSFNRITEYSFLENLTRLQSLGLCDTQITDFRVLENLTGLQSLELSFNRITDYSFLENLIELQSLFLGHNQISDIQVLKNLTKLQSLYLRDNQITDIRVLENLTGLQSLDLSCNKISEIQVLGNLTGLQSLDLRDNKISEVQVLVSLTGLQSLDLKSNKITDIRALEKLTGLESLDLRRNEINSIQELIPMLKKGLPINLEEYGGMGISLFDNPIVNPPINILEQGAEAIITYFEQFNRFGSEKLYEARIVIVGEPGAGKTTLFMKLQDERILVPDPNQKSTHGININQERIFKHAIGVDIKASIWDFGGQDTQNYLHQYFYAKDNLFILVCDYRAEKYRFNYWFEMITRLCAESYVIIVRNQNNRETALQALNLKEYEERFPSLKLSHVDIDFKKTDACWCLLIQTIEKNLSQMQRVNQEVPKKWKPIRDAIALQKEMGKPYITYSDYENICSQNDLKEREYQEQCLDYLHWLGYALHYNDLSLANTIFISPEWITKGLYEILREENYKNGNRGRFSGKDIHGIWKDKSSSDRNLLLSLLLKDRFEVCYKVENSNSYIVPVLISNIQNEPEKDQGLPYKLRFKFPFMPFGFFSRLIVRLFDKIWDDYVWHTGVWLNDGKSCKARMEHFKDINTGDEVFEILIYGNKKERKELLAEIRTEILHIRKLLFPNLIIEEQIPCFCEECLNLKTPYYHSRIDLEKMAERNQFHSQCKNSGKLISTAQLLDSIINTEELEKQYEKMKNPLVKIENNPVFNQTTNIETNANAQAEAEAKAKAIAKNEVTITINNILGEIQNLKEDFKDEKKLLLKKGIDEDDYEVALKDIGKAETAIQELEAAQQQNNPLPEKSKNRLKGFIDDLSDENSTLHKGLKLLKKGRDYAVNLAKAYNKIAENTGMPMVPPLALEVIEKL